MKRPLLITLALAALMLSCAWYFYEPSVMILPCFIAAVMQLVRMAYYAVRRNRAGLKLSGIRFLIWVAVAAGIVAAHDFYIKLSKSRGDALVAALKTYHARERQYPAELAALAPRDIAEIPLQAAAPFQQRKFVYRSNGETFTLMFISGFLVAMQYDSKTGQWENLDY